MSIASHSNTPRLADAPVPRIRVVMLIESLARGGAEAFTTALASELDSTRFDVTVCITRNDGDARADELRRAGVRTLRLSRTRTADLIAWVPLIRILRQERVDVLHGHMFGSNVWAAIIGRLARVPAVIATEHSWSYAGQRLRRIVDGYLIGRLVTVFVAVSRTDARNMIQLEGVPPRKIRLIETSLPHRVGGPVGDGQAFRRSVGVAVDAPLICNVAALAPAKALDVLVRAMALVRGQVPEARLVIAGEGTEREGLARLVEQLGLDEAVSLIGHRDDIPDLLAACDVFALSSDNEGTPLAVIEAMNAGCPVVATAVGGVPDVLGHGSFGRLVDRRDVAGLAVAIVAILGDSDARRELADRGQAHARGNYTLETAVRRWQGLYEELAGRSRRRQHGA